MHDILLALPVFLPLLGGGSIFLIQRRLHRHLSGRKLEYYVGGLVLLNSLLVAALLLGRNGLGKDLVLFYLFSNLKVMFKLDRLGSVFAGLVAFLWPLATLYSFEYMKHEERKDTFFAWYVMTYGVTMGIALAGNLVTLYFFYEMLTLITFPLVLYPLSREASRASRMYLYYSIGGAAFAFIGLVFVLIYSSVGTSDFLPGGVLDLARAVQSRNLLLLIYVLAFFGFGVKAALLPCHAWLPKATVAPTPVTALLHAVAVVKSGAFAILRLTYYSYGTEFLRGSWAQWVVMGAAMITILFGSTMAFREVHWKRRLAYSTVSNLSYILFGASMMTPLGLAAALSHLVAHAFMKICSFFCAGAVLHQSGKEYIYELDGLGKKMPVTFGCLTVASLSLMGIPLFAGFISKWNLCQSAFSWGGEAVSLGIPGGFWPYVGVAVILYSALMTGIYMLTVLVRAYFPELAGKAVVGNRDEFADGAVAGSQKAPADRAAAGKRDELADRAVAAGKKAEDGTAMASGAEGDFAVTDPGWKMLVPLVVFAVAILGIGLHSGPLMEFLNMIGGEAG